MADLSDLVGGPPAAAGGRQVLRGRVARAPVNGVDSMDVLVPSFSGVLSYEVPAGNWTCGTALPVEGATCLVLLDSDNDAFVPTYEGQGDVAASEAELQTHEAAATGVHGIPALGAGDAGKGLVWTGSGWSTPDVATQAELDAVQLKTSVDLTATKAAATGWSVINTWTGSVRGASSIMSISSDHVTANVAGLYLAAPYILGGLATGDFIPSVVRNAAASAIVPATGDEFVQQRQGPLANTHGGTLCVPLVCAVGDKIHCQVFVTNAMTLTCVMRVVYLGT